MQGPKHQLICSNLQAAKEQVRLLVSRCMVHHLGCSGVAMHGRAQWPEGQGRTFAAMKRAVPGVKRLATSFSRTWYQ